MAHEVKQDTSSRSDGIYERLRLAIVTGQVRPNERLIEVELAQQLEVSRTPIREGLLRLAAEGLVISRRHGWVVREHTRNEIRSIYETRAALEGYCARLAAERATDAELKAIASLHRDNTAGLTVAARRNTLVDINEEFHDAIVHAAQNERL